MKIDKKDFERVLSKTKITIKEKHIIDKDKYIYWYGKTDEYVEAMNRTNTDKVKYLENFHQCLLASFEMYKYAIIQRRELILLITMLKYHNSINPKNKLFINDKGRRVVKRDR